MKIKINWLEDSHECETCGWSGASGAMVTMPDGEVLDFTPYAHCFDTVHYDTEQIYRAIINRLGYDITEVYEDRTD